jgi:FtsP/CotA-like multicopper oxidase with cupredoxin domain
MMKKINNKWILLSIAALFVVGIIVSVFIYNSQTEVTAENKEGGQLATAKVSKDHQGRTLKQFTVVAKETKWLLDSDIQVNALAYDGTVPGKTIQVKQGDRVQIQLKNQMKEPVSIHWHGYPVPNDMDGVPNFTQDPVAPGKSFTYDFIATVPGTYFYHSHFDSSNQVDRGLYGAFIVLPKQDTVKYDREYVLTLDEWMIDKETGREMNMEDSSNMEMDHSNMNMDHSNMDMDDSKKGSSDMNMDHDEMMKEMYNVYTVNGKTGSFVKPLKVKKGERVRIRFINAGFQTHKIHLQDQEFQVISTDGNDIKNAPVIKNQIIPIGASERYDISFVAGEKSFAIDLHDGTPGTKTLLIPVQVEGDKKALFKSDQSQLPTWDLANYNKDSNKQSGAFQSSYTLRLNSKMENGEQVYTINGKTWPNTDQIPVKSGETVKIKLINEGKSDHPMHLHGHTFQVLTKNGKPVSENINKDTLVVKPGETYEIGFTANNPGNWMFHCHDLHHAAAGMMTDIKYSDYQAKYQPDRNKAHE